MAIQWVLNGCRRGRMGAAGAGGMPGLLRAALVLAAAVLAWSPASAAVIEEVIVTAQKRAEDVQDVPISVTAFRGEDIDKRGLSDLTELSYFVPNFSIDSSNTSRNTTINIRGIGSSGTNPGIESSVGLFVDGIYMPTGAMSIGELADINTVEVLRGPQGTLYGRNTPVGALNVTTRRPDQTFEAMVRGGAGDYEHRWLNGYVGGGLSDSTAGRLVMWYRDRDGYEKNLFTNDRVNDHSEWGARGRLAITLSDAAELNLIAFVQEVERACCVGEQRDPLGPDGIATAGFLAAQQALGFPFRNFDDDDRRVDADDEGDDQTDTWGLSAQLDWTLPSEHVLTAIASYQDWENDVIISADSLPQNVFDSAQVQVNETSSLEVRIASPGGGKVDYLTGLYLYNQDTTFDQFNVIGPGANRTFPPGVCGGIAPCRFVAGDSGGTAFDQETRSVAVFGSMTWYLTEQFSLTGGLRYSRDKKEIFLDHFNTPGSSRAFNSAQRAFFYGDDDRVDENVTWSISGKYQLSDDVMLFATIATGFKSGGFNSRRQAPGSLLEFEEEETLSYDLGVKSVWLDRRLLVNATIFQTDLEDFQEATLDPNLGSGFIISNAGDRRVRGLELEFTALPLPQLDITGAVAFMDAEFTDYTAGQCPAGRPADGSLPGTCDFTGETPSRSPEWKWNLGTGWTQSIPGADVEWFARVDYIWTDDQIFSPSLDPGTGQDAYGLLNLRLGLRAQDQRWEVEAFGKNVLDEPYYVMATNQPVAAFVSGGGVAGARGFIGWYGQPRTWGVQLTWRPQ